MTPILYRTKAGEEIQAFRTGAGRIVLDHDILFHPTYRLPGSTEPTMEEGQNLDIPPLRRGQAINAISTQSSTGNKRA